MKLLMVLALLSTTAFAAENNKCETELNQNALKCQKMRQICARLGSVESLPYELCMDDFYACVQEGKEAYQACLEEQSKK